MPVDKFCHCRSAVPDELGMGMPTSMRSWVFVRHAHPISAWSRWVSTPLVVAPLWYRRSWAALPIAAWMIINPIITPPVTDDRAFATRAILGEEQWIADHHQAP